MIVRELLTIARQVELRVARLYEHMARNFRDDKELEQLLQSLSTQEIQHADIIEQMLRESSAPETELLFESQHFTTFIDTIDDVEDEVCVRHIDINAAMEIVTHMEESIAESFYKRIPENTPGISDKVIQQMVLSSQRHAKEGRDFLEKCKTRIA